MSDSCTSENVRYKECKVRWNFKSKRNLLNHKYFKDCASQTFVTTILVTYVTILTEPDLSLKN